MLNASRSIAKWGVFPSFFELDAVEWESDPVKFEGFNYEEHERFSFFV